MLLEKASNNDLSECKPSQLLACPESMQAFIYICSNLNDNLYYADGYWWKDGSSKIGQKQGVKSHYYYIMMPPEESSESTLGYPSSKFKKTVFTLAGKELKRGSPVFVWYSGDKKAVKSVSHGNSKEKRLSLPTIPSFRKAIKSELLTNGSNKKAYVNLKETALNVDRKFLNYRNWVA